MNMKHLSGGTYKCYFLGTPTMENIARIPTNPILALAKFRYEEYVDGTVEPVCLTQADTLWAALFFILTITVFFIIPLAILIILYTVIAKNLMENPVIIAHNSKSHNQSGSVLRYRKQVVLMLGTVVLSFFICLLPFKALTLWIIVFPPETIINLGLEGYYILLYFCRIMLYLNSAINPILYNLMSSKFRDGFMRLLRINKCVNCRRNWKENMHRRDTFNTTTSTGFSSSQHNSDSFWRRYSSRTSSQKHSVHKRDSVKAVEPKVEQLIVGEIIHVVNTRRNSMKMLAELIDANIGDNSNELEANHLNEDDNVNNSKNLRPEDVNVEDLAIISGDMDNVTENNKQIQILNLDIRTNSVYSVTLDISANSDKNKFVCVPLTSKDRSDFVYDYNGKESFV